jgi:hypothetical protein
MSITALFLHPLGPALILGLGGILIALSRRVVADPLPQSDASPGSDIPDPLYRPRLRFPLRALFAIAVVAGAFVLLLVLRVRPGSSSLAWPWQPLTVAGSTSLWELDGWNWLASLLLLLLTVAALVLGEFREDLRPVRTWPGREAERTLWLGAAALCFVCSANVVTLAGSWILLDMALLVRLRPGESEEPAGRVWSLLSLTCLVLLAALMLAGEENVRVALAGGQFPPAVLGLLWFAALVRAGVYPFHFWLVGPGRMDAGGRVALHLVAPLTGLWLLGRVNQFSAADWIRRPEWAALGALALMGTALVAWAAENQQLRWRWIVLNRASLIVLGIYMVATAGARAQVWLLTTFALGGAALLVAMAMQTRWGTRWPLVLAALVVWGVPGTAGFLARVALVFPNSLTVGVPLFALVLISEALLVAALWQAAAGAPNRLEPVVETGAASPIPGPQRSMPPYFRWLTAAGLGLTFALLILPLLFSGIFPQRTAALMRVGDSGSYPPLLSAVANARRLVWVGLVFSGLAGVALGLLRSRIFSRMRGWQSGIVTVVSLEWLYRGIVEMLTLAGAGLRYFSVLGEGEGYVGWLLLAGVILWLLLHG